MGNDAHFGTLKIFSFCCRIKQVLKLMMFLSKSLDYFGHSMSICDLFQITLSQVISYDDLCSYVAPFRNNIVKKKNLFNSICHHIISYIITECNTTEIGAIYKDELRSKPAILFPPGLHGLLYYLRCTMHELLLLSILHFYIRSSRAFMTQIPGTTSPIPIVVTTAQGHAQAHTSLICNQNKPSFLFNIFSSPCTIISRGRNFCLIGWWSLGSRSADICHAIIIIKCSKFIPFNPSYS